ncbi:hypothetical protein ACJX0J_028359, partial [Zea mays]
NNNYILLFLKQKNETNVAFHHVLILQLAIKYNNMLPAGLKQGKLKKRYYGRLPPNILQNTWLMVIIFIEVFEME